MNCFLRVLGYRKDRVKRSSCCEEARNWMDLELGGRRNGFKGMSSSVVGFGGMGFWNEAWMRYFWVYFGFWGGF